MNRTAVIVTRTCKNTTARYVECYEDDVLIRDIDVSDHSQYYAEDTAENWENGIIPREP